jgi:hypothetical protein
MFTNVSVFVVVDNMTKIDALGHLTAAGAPSETHTHTHYLHNTFRVMLNQR